MPAGKKKGQGSPKKTIGQTTTRRKAKQQRQQDEIVSLASLSSPVTSPKPKKLSTVREDQKQAVVNSPEQEQETIAQDVTATKQSKKSSDKEEHSSGSDLSGFQVKPSTWSRTSTISNLLSTHALTQKWSTCSNIIFQQKAMLMRFKRCSKKMISSTLKNSFNVISNTCKV